MLAIIQARFSSKRLKGKVLRKIKKKELLKRVFDRGAKSKKVKKIIIATSTHKSDDKIAKFLNTKKKRGLEFKKITVVNNKIFIFLKNSFILKFDLYGNLEDLKKLPSKINSQPIFIDRSILYLDKNRRLSIID